MHPEHPLWDGTGHEDDCLNRQRSCEVGMSAASKNIRHPWEARGVAEAGPSDMHSGPSTGHDDSRDPPVIDAWG